MLSDILWHLIAVLNIKTRRSYVDDICELPEEVTRVHVECLGWLHLSNELEKNFWLTNIHLNHTSWNFGDVSQDVLETDTLREVPCAGKSKIENHRPERRSPPQSLQTWWPDIFHLRLSHVILHPHPSNIITREISAICVIGLVFMSNSCPFSAPRL